MRRREFIALLGGAAARGRSRRARSRASGCGASECFRAARTRTIRARSPTSRRSCKRCSNWVGPTAETCRIDYRWPAGDADKARKYAAELVALAPDVILAVGTASLAPLLQATRTVPIVFVAVADPVGAGFVDSLSRPGGNATGFMLFDYGLSAKWLELLKADRAGRDASGGPSGSRDNLRDRPVRRHPVRGAVARRGGEPGQRARRRRDRARRRGLRALRQWRPDRDGERVGARSSRTDHRACGPAQAARGLLRTRLRHRRRPDLLWA